MMKLNTNYSQISIFTTYHTYTRQV